MGSYIRGLPSGLSDTQEIVLKCPRGCKAIRFRVEEESVREEGGREREVGGGRRGTLSRGEDCKCSY